MSVVYLTPGVFDKGGTSRYGRYQIQALRELVAKGQTYVLSLLGPGSNDFEEPFKVDFYGGGTGWTTKAQLSLKAARFCLLQRPGLIWCSHIHFLPLGIMLRQLVPSARLFVNVYGLELWSGRQNVHKYVLPRADRVVSDCFFSAEFVKQHYAISPDRINTIWDCVDTTRFHAKPRREDLLRQFGVPVGADYKYVLTLGRLDRGSRHKGFDRLIDAAKEFQNDRRVIILFAGNGNDRSRLQERVRELGLEKAVFFLGSVPEALLVDVYNLCDVFVLVSDRGAERGEGLPLALLEATACSKPIIAGDEDGSQEAVVDGATGFVVSPRNPSALVAAIGCIVNDDGLRKRMGQAARMRAEKEFSYIRFRERTAGLLKEIGCEITEV